MTGVRTRAKRRPFPRYGARAGRRGKLRWNWLIVVFAAIVTGRIVTSTDSPFFNLHRSPSDSIGRGQIVGVASVVDGDTLSIHGTRIRFHGIDAPESAQLCTDGTGRSWRCGQRAALALADRIGRSTVSCQPNGKDQYGRVLAVCYQGSEDLNRWMVAEGWAVAYRHYSADYVAPERAAKAARKNIWASRFDMPWDWRRGHRGV
jgi:endonuclease YncB( thermonuclease family)